MKFRFQLRFNTYFYPYLIPGCFGFRVSGKAIYGGILYVLRNFLIPSRPQFLINENISNLIAKSISHYKSENKSTKIQCPSNKNLKGEIEISDIVKD